MSEILQLWIGGFMAVPLKKTNTTSWAEQIKACLKDIDLEEGCETEADIKALDRMRIDMMGVEATDSGALILYRYLIQLDQLIIRFPTLQKPQNINFEWFDAFETDFSIKQSSLAFEKANVAFNFAAIASRKAGNLKTTAENLPQMAKSFQQSASLFKWISENFLHPPLSDLQQSSLKFLTELMLTQAQECYLIKASLDQKSPSILSKLCKALSAGLEKCNLILESSEKFKNSLSTACKDLCQQKELYFRIMSQYYKAEALVSAEKHGEALTRFRLVLDSLGDLPGNLSSEIEPVILARIEKVEHENNFIFHLSEPDLTTLKPVESADLTKMSTFNEVLKELGIDENQKQPLFKTVLPPKLLAQLSQYSEEKSKILRYENHKVDEADEQLDLLVAQSKSLLSQPSYLQRILNQLESIKNENHASDQESILEEIRKTLIICEDMIKQDTHENDCFCAEYDSGGMQQILNDKSLWSQYEKEESRIEQRKSQKSELEIIIKRISCVNKTQSCHLIEVEDKESKILTSIEKMKSLQRIWKESLTLLKSKILEDDISEKLIGKSEFSKILQAELKKFDPYCNEIEEAVKEFKVTLDGTEDMLASSTQSKMESAELDGAIKEALQIQSSLRDDERHFSELLDRVKNYERSIRELVVRRETERKEMMKRFEMDPAFRTQKLLKAKLSSMNIATKSDEDERNQIKPGQAANTGNTGSLLD